MADTHGQAAYDAYVEAAGSKNDWAALTQTERDHWEATAEAVTGAKAEGNQSLGQAAYDAYVGAEGGQGTWGEVIHRYWDAAAQAVVQAEK